MQWNLVLAIATVVVVGVQAEDDCAPKPGEKHVHPWECCNIKDVVPDMSAGIKKCIEKFPMPAKPTGPPAAGATGPPPEVKKAMACSAECVFGESKLLTADKKLDKAAILKAFSAGIDGDKELVAILNAAVDKCVVPAVDQPAECQSGAREFEECMMREGFLNCPKSRWTASPECSQLKEKITKCSKMSVMLPKPPVRT